MSVDFLCSEDHYSVTVLCQPGYSVPQDLQATTANIHFMTIFCHHEQWLIPTSLLEEGCSSKTSLVCEELELPEFVVVLSR